MKNQCIVARREPVVRLARTLTVAAAARPRAGDFRRFAVVALRLLDAALVAFASFFAAPRTTFEAFAMTPAFLERAERVFVDWVLIDVFLFFEERVFEGVVDPK